MSFGDFTEALKDLVNRSGLVRLQNQIFGFKQKLFCFLFFVFLIFIYYCHTTYKDIQYTTLLTLLTLLTTQYYITFSFPFAPTVREKKKEREETTYYICT